MAIKGPVRQVSQPIHWREPRTFSSVEDYPEAGWAHTASEWHRTHKAPPRTYPRWPLWEGLEQAYEQQEANYPQVFPHPQQHLPYFPHYQGHVLPMEYRRDLPVHHARPHADAINRRLGYASPPTFFSPPMGIDRGDGAPMRVDQALATPPVMPHTFPRPSQPAVPVMAPVTTPGAPQVAGYQIVGSGSSPPAEGVSLGMVVLALAAGFGVGYLAVKAST
jgi:hypothetical protein